MERRSTKPAQAAATGGDVRRDGCADGADRPSPDDRADELVGAVNRAQQLITEIQSASEAISGAVWAPEASRPTTTQRLAMAKRVDELFARFYGQTSLAGIARTTLVGHVRATPHGPARSSGAAILDAFGSQFPEYARRLTAADIDALLDSRRGRGRPTRTAALPRSQTVELLDATEEDWSRLPEFRRRLLDAFQKMGIPTSVDNLHEVLRRPRRVVGIPSTSEVARQRKQSAQK